jgi:signal transduction histidine kinase
VESRNGLELLKLEGADAIQELHRVAQQLREGSLPGLGLAVAVWALPSGGWNSLPLHFCGDRFE